MDVRISLTNEELEQIAGEVSAYEEALKQTAKNYTYIANRHGLNYRQLLRIRKEWKKQKKKK